MPRPTFAHRIYSSHLAFDWQRLVCAKELIHVMDGKQEKTKTPDELQGPRLTFPAHRPALAMSTRG
jgi:hypothetical protein